MSCGACLRRRTTRHSCALKPHESSLRSWRHMPPGLRPARRKTEVVLRWISHDASTWVNFGSAKGNPRLLSRESMQREAYWQCSRPSQSRAEGPENCNLQSDKRRHCSKFGQDELKAAKTAPKDWFWVLSIRKEKE
ncbi:hypothetical protein E2562_017230 [Oryza meyeriana var. granulata]|uniref:Uncharacterized protein n=1 Tax=Oryza meyeriana var. granulata TaxID=110450 RepID=A0A6G1EM13_9ORYZ|nr:hypothetical protein E2562_017230 [Oryza meyeriana var. granulata]